VYLFIIPKAINPCTQRRFLLKKLVKIGKDLIIELKIGKTKEAIKSLTAKCIAKD